MKATPEQVWDVLADGWLYPRGRGSDPDARGRRPLAGAGARLHHSVGSWPPLIDDTDQVLECRPPGPPARARAWPGGEAEVTLHLEPHAGGTT